MYTIDAPQKTEFPELLALWESSVRATHHFLRDNDIDFFRNIIREKDVFSHVTLACARDEQNRILGFLGVSGDNLEMLFVDAQYIGKGVGKMLLLHAIDHLHINKVDVNEQNEQALAFYKAFGFRVVSRSELDGTGKPYPILHMQLT